jgi:hypothetical protein
MKMKKKNYKKWQKKMRTTFDIQEKLASHFGFWRVLGMGIEMRIKKREKREENKEKKDGSSKPN